jgi:DNA polymerase elongation subunit (family B)
MFGLDEKGRTCSILVDDFKPFFYVKGGDHWSSTDANALLKTLRRAVGAFFAPLVLSAEIVQRHPLYGFTGGLKHSFVKLTFANLGAMKRAKRLWYTYDRRPDGSSIFPPRFTPPEIGGVALQLYESNIPPMLRFFHIHNISPSGWVLIRSSSARRTVSSSQKETTCHYEYICSTKCVVPLSDKEVRVPYKICSFDIEASSSHGDFPLPVKTYKRLASNILDAFYRKVQLTGQSLSEDQGNVLLRRILLTAFGFDRYENVDLVYPKRPLSKDRLVERIEVILQTPIQNAKWEVEENNARILEIDSVFQSMVAAAANDMGGGGDEDDDNDDEQHRSATTKRSKLTREESALTLVRLLQHPKLERDVKMRHVNEMLTLRLPQLEGDQVTFIGSTFLRYGETDPYLNHCLVLGSCDPVEGAQIQCEPTERQLLLAWQNLIQRENPDIVIGYNIFGFDYEFMFRRAQELDCSREFLQLSRISRAVVDDLENTKIVLATGEYDLRYASMTGRIQIDMYTYFRRDFNLPSYKLDDVASANISDDIKHVVSDGTTTELFSKNLTGIHVGDFIHIEITGFTTDYYQQGKKFRVLALDKGRVFGDATYNVIVVAGVVEALPNKTLRWGVAKDDISHQDIFRLGKGSDADRAIVAKYCLQDCNLVHHLMNKIDVITGYVEMSRICSVPISFLVLRGQGIKLTSYVAKKCRIKDTLMPDLEKTTTEEGYEGAIVLPPKCAMYMDNPVACVDYSSLYPSSMISQNYSHDSKVWTREYDLTGALVAETGVKDPTTGNFVYDNLPSYQYIDVEFDTYTSVRKTPTSRPEKVISGKKCCRWVQLPHNQKSVMPAILEELLSERKKTRKLAEAETDPFIANILDKRQLGYKVTANSLYGQCGAKTSTFYEQDVAASTTATGRMMIIYAKKMVETVYGYRIYPTVGGHGDVLCKAEYVYGDTDSVFFTFNLEDPATGTPIRGPTALAITIEIAQDVAKLCTQFLKPPMELSYEKTLMPFILLSKKRYVGMLYETNPSKGKMKYMGLSLKRRDSCDYLKDTYGGILNILMKQQNLPDAIAFLDHALEQLSQGNVPMEKLTITKALRSDYKNPAQIGHWVLAERMGQRDAGTKPKPGDRMKFVFIVNHHGATKGKALLGDKIETPDFVQAQGIKIDYTYYITNQLMKPLQQLFGLALIPMWEAKNKGQAILSYHKEMAKLQKEFPDTETFMKKKEKYCSAKVKTMLFDKHLVKIQNDSQGLQSIVSFLRVSR